jgi:hypothetical protein
VRKFGRQGRSSRLASFLDHWNATVDGEVNAIIIEDKIFDVKDAAIASAFHGAMSATAAWVRFVSSHYDAPFRAHEFNVRLKFVGVAQIRAVPRVVIFSALAPKTVMDTRQCLGATVIVLD